MAEPGVTTYCYCWVIDRTDGVTIGTTDHDEDVVVAGVTCNSAPGVTTTRFEQSLGLSADDVEIEGVVDSDLITEDDLRAGRYDNASVSLFIVNWEDPADFELLSTGTLGQVTETDGGGFRTEHMSLMDKLAQPVGRVFQRTCDTKLGSTRCGVDLSSASYRVTGTVVSADGATVVVTGVGTYDDGWFTLGSVTAASGYEVGIRHHADDTLQLWREPDVTISPGDELVIVAGCKQDIGTCRQKFNNVVNFQGFPRMPGRDRLSQYAIRGEGNYNGGSLF